MLLLNAYMLKREVGAARMQLVAMTSINSKIGGGGGGTKYSEIEPAEPIKGPRHNIELGELLDAVKKLMALQGAIDQGKTRSEEHKSELQSLMSISYAVFCLK